MIPAASKPDQIKKILLVGNPNAGKSVLFGKMTGQYVIVSNYPGTTVEISRSKLKIEGKQYELIDSPGVNSLVPQSEDERVTRDLILQEKPDVILQIGDAKNLRRALFLTLQLAEFGIPLVLNLNMLDECRARGIEIDTGAIEEMLEIPVNTSIATLEVGIHQLLRMIPRAKAPRLPVAFSSTIIKPARSLLPGHLPPALSLEWLLQEPAGEYPLLQGMLSAEVLARLKKLVLPSNGGGNSLWMEYFDRERNRFLSEWLPAIRTQRESTGETIDQSWRKRLVLAALMTGIAVHLSNYLLPLSGRPGPAQAIGQWLETVLVPYFHGRLAGLGMKEAAAVLFTTAGGPGILVGKTGLFHPGLTNLICYILPPALPFLFALRTLPSFAAAFDRWSRRTLSGLGILFLFLSSIYLFVGHWAAQILVGFMENVVFGKLINPLAESLLDLLPLPQMIRDLLMGPFGLISMGLSYSIAIVFPVVGAFFLIFGFLEDSGYLPRLAILVNRVFRTMGLNGKAVLPMVLGLGCGTMATMTARILNSPKERLIATLLLALGIPCSAQLGVVLGIVAGFSPKVVLLVAGTVLVQLLLVGFLAGRLLPGDASDFIMEIPPIRYPVWKNVLLKTWLRVVWFLKEAVPLFLAGTLLLFILDRLSLLNRLTHWAEPVVQWFLGLPAECAPVFVMGFLRRDYGAAGLFELVQQGRVGPEQVAVALICLTLFIPCVANLLVIIKEQGLAKAAAIAGFIIPVAILTGGAVHFLLEFFKIKL